MLVSSARRAFGVLLLLSLLSCSSVWHQFWAPKNEDQAPSVRGYWVQKDCDAYGLMLRLTNELEVPIVVPHKQLWRDAMFLEVVDSSTGAPLQEFAVFDDLPASSTRLEPGESLEREIALESRFPALSKSPPDDGVYIHWGIDLAGYGGSKPRRVEGSVNVDADNLKLCGT